MAIIPDASIARKLLASNRRGLTRAFHDGVAADQAANAMAQGMSQVASWAHSTMRAYAEGNLLPNGDFEEIGSQNFPFGFEITSGNSSLVTASTENSLSGGRTIKFAPSSSTVVVKNTEYIPVEPGRAYGVEVTAYSDGSTATFYTNVELYDGDLELLSTSSDLELTFPDGEHSTQATTATLGTNNFVAADLTARYMRLKFRRVDALAGDFYVDKISVHRLPFFFQNGPNVDQSVAADTSTVINLDALSTASYGKWYDYGAATWRNLDYNNRFTAPKSGAYLIGGHMVLPFQNYNMLFGFDWNGTGDVWPAVAQTISPAPSGGAAYGPRASFAYVQFMTAGAYIEYKTMHNAGGARSIQSYAPNKETVLYALELF